MRSMLGVSYWQTSFAGIPNMKKTSFFLILFSLLIFGALAACASPAEPSDGPQVVVYRSPT
jgi:hypothetical protein